MLTKEQMRRALTEFAESSGEWFQAARRAEIEYERLAYLVAPEYDREKTLRAFLEYQEADYYAESRAWIKGLIQKAISEFISP
jgi:hypothetical protein